MSTNTERSNWVILFTGTSWHCYNIMRAWRVLVGSWPEVVLVCLSVKGLQLKYTIVYVPFWHKPLKYCFPHQNVGNSCSSLLGEHIAPQLRGIKTWLQCICQLFFFFDLIHGCCWKTSKTTKSLLYMSAPSVLVSWPHPNHIPCSNIYLHFMAKYSQWF